MGGKKRHLEWCGTKVQLTETDDEELPHIITDIVVTSSAQADCEELVGIQLRLADRDRLPTNHYVDSGYMNGSNWADGQTHGIDLIGPLLLTRHPKIVSPMGLLGSSLKLIYRVKTSLVQ